MIFWIITSYIFQRLLVIFLHDFFFVNFVWIVPKAAGKDELESYASINDYLSIASGIFFHFKIVPSGAMNALKPYLI